MKQVPHTSDYRHRGARGRLRFTIYRVTDYNLLQQLHKFEQLEVDYDFQWTYPMMGQIG